MNMKNLNIIIINKFVPVMILLIGILPATGTKY